jgi:hypothetical protein
MKPGARLLLAEPAGLRVSDRPAIRRRLAAVPIK